MTIPICFDYRNNGALLSIGGCFDARKVVLQSRESDAVYCAMSVFFGREWGFIADYSTTVS
jgi:hypothetical protein